MQSHLAQVERHGPSLCHAHHEQTRNVDAGVAKLADAQDLGSCPERGVGSSPSARTKTQSRLAHMGSARLSMCQHVQQ